MGANLWTGLLGALVGGITAIGSSWMTAALKRRSDTEARRQERQFRIADQEREDHKQREREAADEDKYWFEKSVKFAVVKSKVLKARGREEIIAADDELVTFLENAPEYLLRVENLDFFYRYCNSDFRSQHPDLKGTDPALQRFARALIDFRCPSGYEVRHQRTAFSDNPTSQTTDECED